METSEDSSMKVSEALNNKSPENFDFNDYIEWGSDSEDVDKVNPDSAGLDKVSLDVTPTSSFSSVDQNLMNQVNMALFKNVLVDIAHSPNKTAEMTFED
jgi:hypothetical protein